MKKFLNAMLLLALMPVAMLAENAMFSAPATTNTVNSELRVPFMIQNELPASMKAVDNTLGATYNSFKNQAGTALRSSWSLASGTEPFIYEPISKSYLIVARDMANDIEFPEDVLKRWGTTYILSSNNEGATWEYNEIYRSQNNINVQPTIAVANPKGTSNPLDFNYFIFSRLAKFVEGKSTADWIGAQLLFYSDDYTGHIEQSGPENNNPNGRQEWYLTRSTSYQKGGDFRTLNASMLSPVENTGTQYGAYGQLGVNLSNVDFNSKIPAEWGLNKFKPSTELNSSFNNGLYIDSDVEGNVYVALNNFFVDAQNNRRLGVSVSSDNGTTWSDFNKMPLTVLDNFAATMGLPKDSLSFEAWQRDAFVVYDLGKFSYFCILLAHPDDDIFYQRYMVEINFDGSTWSMKQIGRMQYDRNYYVGPNLMNGTMYGINLQKLNPTSTTDDEEFPFLSTIPSEIDASISEDGYMIVKWLDWRADEIAFPTTGLYSRISVAGEENAYREYAWDTIPSNDIFMAHRKMNETSWVVKNVTDDQVYNKNTFMPKRVKSVNKIPVACYTIDETRLKTSYPEYADLPSVLVGMVNDINFYADMKYLVVDAINPNSVEDLNYTNNRMEIFPNPVSGIANLNFAVENSGNVVIRISNSLGQTVAEIANGDYATGTFSTKYDASNLVNGTYFVTMTQNGNSVTKVLNVVR